MSKAAISIVTLGAGLTAFVMIAQIQRDPFTFTSESDEMSEAATKPLAPALATNPEDARTLALNVVRKASGPARAVPSESASPTLERSAADHRSVMSTKENTAQSLNAEPAEHEFAPCSPWRDLGPKLGEVKGESSSRSVRQLC